MKDKKIHTQYRWYETCLEKEQYARTILRMNDMSEWYLISDMPLEYCAEWHRLPNVALTFDQVGYLWSGFEYFLNGFAHTLDHIRTTLDQDTTQRALSNPYLTQWFRVTR